MRKKQCNEIKKQCEWTSEPLRWFDLSIAMVSMTLKNDSYPIPRLEFFEEKSSRFIIYSLIIYILFNKVHFVRHFVSQK